MAICAVLPNNVKGLCREHLRENYKNAKWTKQKQWPNRRLAGRRLVKWSCNSEWVSGVSMAASNRWLECSCWDYSWVLWRLCRGVCWALLQEAACWSKRIQSSPPERWAGPIFLQTGACLLPLPPPCSLPPSCSAPFVPLARERNECNYYQVQYQRIVKQKMDFGGGETCQAVHVCAVKCEMLKIPEMTKWAKMSAVSWLCKEQH